MKKTIKKINSFTFVRSKIYGKILSQNQIDQIIKDIVAGNYCDVEISAFITACASRGMNQEEILYLTKAMAEVGNKITWDCDMIVDKHCVGGVPGNRTTPIVVAIIAAFGLKIPKTSSRAITSASGTADTMEVLTKVEFDVENIKKIVNSQNGCLVWGGLSSLSPADDIFVKIERILNLDGEGQLIASILSKKIATGASHILIDIPIGKTAKVHNLKAGNIIKNHLEKIGKILGIKVKTIFTSGLQPIGNGIGPALEARDVVMVLKNEKNAPSDLRNNALILAGKILEFSPQVKKGDGKNIAEEILNNGKAWEKFQAICEMQGGLKQIPQASITKPILATKDGIIFDINNRHIASIAKLSGAPNNKVAGIYLNVKVGDKVKKGDILFTIHANQNEAIEAALDYFSNNLNSIQIV